MRIECKMVYCSNPESKGMRELNNVSDLDIGLVFIFGSIYSSRIQKIEFKEDFIEIQTKNTMYHFVRV